MTYTTTAKIRRDVYDRVTGLLSSGADEDHWENIYYVKFGDGSGFTWDLGSDWDGYYGDVVWYSNDDRDDVFPDHQHELSDIELRIGDNTYVIKIEVE